MPVYIKGIKASKLRYIMGQERIGVTELYEKIKEQCKELGIKPMTQSAISIFSFGEKQDAKISTYLRILYGLNALRIKSPEPYKIEDIIDVDEILKPKKQIKP